MILSPVFIWLWKFELLQELNMFSLCSHLRFWFDDWSCPMPCIIELLSCLLQFWSMVLSPVFIWLWKFELLQELNMFSSCSHLRFWFDDWSCPIDWENLLWWYVLCFLAKTYSDPLNKLDINDKAIIMINALIKRFFLLIFEFNL